MTARRPTQVDPEAAKALDRARRVRVSKPADQRRGEILAAAARMFRDHGYDAATVQAIAGEAGVAAGTVYLHFAAKDAILAALQQEFEEGLLVRFAEIAQNVVDGEIASGEIVSYEDVTHRLIDGLVRYALDNRVVAQVIARQVGRVAVVPDGPILAGGLTELLARLIREGVRLGYVQTSDPEMTAYLLNLAAVSAISNAVAFEDDEMLARVVAQTKELFIKALAP